MVTLLREDRVVCEEFVFGPLGIKEPMRVLNCQMR